jgi:hemerythrin-like domain-containing protein
MGSDNFYAGGSAVAQRKTADRTQASPEGEADIVELLLLDHRPIKDCIEILISPKKNKKEKLAVARDFLNYVHDHSQAEKKTVYKLLEKNEELHFLILEAMAEHAMVDKEVRSLRTKLARARSLRDEVEAELKVLAELVQKHILEEESEMLPKIKSEFGEQELKDIGMEFMKARKLDQTMLTDFPELQEELIQWKDSVQEISSRFLSRMDKYVDNLKH